MLVFPSRITAPEIVQHLNYLLSTPTSNHLLYVRRNDTCSSIVYNQIINGLEIRCIGITHKGWCLTDIISIPPWPKKHKHRKYNNISILMLTVLLLCICSLLTEHLTQGEFHWQIGCGRTHGKPLTCKVIINVCSAQ